MTALEDGLRGIVAELGQLSRSFAIVGGLAVSARAEPRLTRDIDLAVAVDNDADAETLCGRLISGGYDVIALVEQESTNRLATARLSRQNTDVVVDLLFASSGIEAEIVANAEPIAIINELTLPVASVGHLIAMKLLARDDRHRPADADDLRALADISDPNDWDIARTAAELIETRGYARDRNLLKALTHLRTNGPY